MSEAISAKESIDTENARPEDCDCLPSMDPDGLGCFACYRAGFKTANPDATEDD